jgi:acyl-CoA thioester hydrolase
MARIKLEMPEDFRFVTEIPIRITDLNYANHVGNDVFLSLLHEARAQYLHYHHYKEFDMDGKSLIMSDASLEFKNEIFYGDKIKIFVAAGSFARV